MANKRDLLIILLLCLVFLSIALPNIGYAHAFTTTTEMKMGNGFYLDLGSVVDVKSLYFLVENDGFNITVSTGSVDHWDNSFNTFWGFGYRVIPNWQEIRIDQATQYIKVDFGDAWKINPALTEIAVVSQDDQVVAIKSIYNAGSGNPQLQNLIDEQNFIHYPFDHLSIAYFDEPLFVRSAQEYLHLQTHSDLSEVTHPPLGKLIMTLGLAVFGASPFGWRIMGVIFATLMIPLIYLLGKKLFDSFIGGFAAAFLLTFDFMHFTMARLGTVDTFVVFFSLTSQLFFFIYLKNVLKNGWGTSVLPLVLCIVFFGLGFSTKWLVLFGFGGEICILLVLRLIDLRKVKDTLSAKVHTFTARPFLYVILSCLAVCGIYFATYIPDMIAGGSFLDILNLQREMYLFHQSAITPNLFSSPWFSWPLMFNPFNSGVHVPLRLNFEPAIGLQGSQASSIVLMGNPAVWWVGLAAMILLIVVTARKAVESKFTVKDNLLPISMIVIFLCQWLAYIFIERPVFIYHFYSSIPFLCLAVAFFISKYWRNRRMKILTLTFFAIVVGMFILFYPILSGAETSPSKISSLQWINSWMFT